MGYQKIRGWRLAQTTNYTKYFHGSAILVITIMGIPLICTEAVRQGIPPDLPARYHGTGNTLQAFLNASWPIAQGPSAIFTFFAPQNKAMKKYPCLFSNVETLAGKTVATSVLQYHIIPGKVFSSQDMQNLAVNRDYISATAFTGHKLNITKGGMRLNGYSTISDPDLSTKPLQSIQGITTLLVPPGLIIGCGPPAPAVKSYGNSSSSSLSMLLAQMKYVDIGISLLSVVLSFKIFFMALW